MNHPFGNCLYHLQYLWWLRGWFSTVLPTYTVYEESADVSHGSEPTPSNTMQQHATPTNLEVTGRLRRICSSSSWKRCLSIWVNDSDPRVTSLESRYSGSQMTATLRIFKMCKKRIHQAPILSCSYSDMSEMWLCPADLLENDEHQLINHQLVGDLEHVSLFHIFGIIIQKGKIDFHIFQRGRYTTNPINQSMYFFQSFSVFHIDVPIQ